jgi:hypothetical protein
LPAGPEEFLVAEVNRLLSPGGTFVFRLRVGDSLTYQQYPPCPPRPGSYRATAGTPRPASRISQCA